MDSEVGYPLIDGQTCDCSRIMRESCWGYTPTIIRIEYCEAHCPTCKHEREHPVDTSNYTEIQKQFHAQLSAHNRRWHATQGDRGY